MRIYLDGTIDFCTKPIVIWSTVPFLQYRIDDGWFIRRVQFTILWFSFSFSHLLRAKRYLHNDAIKVIIHVSANPVCRSIGKSVCFSLLALALCELMANERNRGRANKRCRKADFVDFFLFCLVMICVAEYHRKKNKNKIPIHIRCN